jgi:multidrug efflux pump subunit AcrB
MNIGKFSIENGVLLNIIMVLLLVVGSVTLMRMPKEAMSDISFSYAFIAIPYPGVAAEDIEKSITIKIEDELADLDRLKEINSVSKEGLAFLEVKFDDGVSRSEFRRLFQDLRAELDKVELPEDALDPIVDEFTTSDFMPVVQINVAGDVPAERLNDVVRDLREEYLDIKNISKVEIIGGREREVWVEANRSKLEAYGVDLNSLIGAIQNRHINIPGGKVETQGQNYLLRTQGEVYSRKEFEDIIVRSLPGKGVVRVKDVAHVNDGLADSDYDVRYNGEQAVALYISKNSKGNSIQIVDEVKRITKKYRKMYGNELSLKFSGDTTIQIRQSLTDLSKNSLAGIILLFITLFLFLGVRNSIITALGIPMTFSIAFIFMNGIGETLNGNSMFALVLVLGMIVDHAIVIIENIYRYRQNGMGKKEAAIKGTNEVVKPVIAATLTTIAAFLPLMLLPGIMGKFMRIIPIVVTLALVASTIEALFFIPLHFSEWGSKVKDDHHAFVWLKAHFNKLITTLYRHKFLTMVGTFGIIISSFMAASTVKAELFGGEAMPQFNINIELPRGSSRAEVNKVVKRFEDVLMPIVKSDIDVDAISVSVGFMTTDTEWLTEDNVAQIQVLMRELSEGRTRKVRKIMGEIKELCKNISGADEISWKPIEGGPPVDKPISVRVLGKNLDDMISVADLLREKLETYPDLYNIDDNFKRNNPELVVTVNEQKAAEFGLSVAQIGMYLRTGVDGFKATTYFDDDDEIDVIVKFDRDSKRSIEDFRELRFPTPDGRLIPFSAVCILQEKNGIAEINRYERKREITVSADTENKSLAPKITEELGALFEDNYAAQFPGVTINLEGEFAEFSNIMTDLANLALIGIFLLYLILGTQFKSYIQPLIMMFTVPFAAVGVIMFLVVSGNPVSIIVMYAMVALVGISVNDSIVLISFINHRRRVEGMSTAEAVIDAATTRLRPIILTSVTTMGGLVPLAIGIGGKSEVWGPMASTIIFGLFFSTAGTLIVIPCAYGILDSTMAKLGIKMKLEGE